MILTQKELYEVSKIYDYLGPIIKKFAKDKSNFLKIKKEIVRCFDKNSTVLQSNLIGKKVLVNDSVQDNIFKILEIDKTELVEALRNSEYFAAFGKKLNLEDQIIFAIPLIILAGEYLKLNRKEEAQFIYLFTFIKPYASIISKYFPYGIIENRMLYTIEYGLSNKSDIRKMKNILEMLIKKSSISLENYAEVLKADKISDRDLHVIFTSGIQSRINNTIKEIANQYAQNKDRYLNYEMSSYVGDNEGEAEYLDRDIMSDSAVKTDIIRRATSKISQNTIDKKAIQAACEVAFKTVTKRYEEHLTILVSEVIEKMGNKISEFYEYLVGAILFHVNPETGKKYTGKDLRGPVFLAASLKIFAKKNTLDKNTIKTKDLINEMLESCSEEYLAAGETKKSQLRTALFFYFVVIARMD